MTFTLWLFPSSLTARGIYCREWLPFRQIEAGDIWHWHLNSSREPHRGLQRYVSRAEHRFQSPSSLPRLHSLVFICFITMEQAPFSTETCFDTEAFTCFPSMTISLNKSSHAHARAFTRVEADRLQTDLSPPFPRIISSKYQPPPRRTFTNKPAPVGTPHLLPIFTRSLPRPLAALP